MKEDTTCRFQEIFEDKLDDDILLDLELSNTNRTYEERLSANVDELRLIYGCHPTSDLHFEEQTMIESPKPKVVTLSHLTEESLDLLVEIQNGLIKYNPSFEPLRVKRDKIHITLIALYERNDLESLFNKTVNVA